MKFRSFVVGVLLFFAQSAAYAAGAVASSHSLSWTGLYVGGNLGYGWGNASTNGGGTTTSTSVVGGTPVATPPAPFSDTGSQRLSGVIGGGQVGYNYQPSRNWMLGFEADFQGAAEQGSKNIANSFSGTFCTIVLPNATCAATTPLNGTVTSSGPKIEWFGTVRGRIGTPINEGLLLYGTGGLAYGRVVSGNVSVSGNAPGFAAFGPTTNGSGQSATNIGFAIGAGLEGKSWAWLPPNWTWKLEYLYVDLGSLNTSTSLAAASSDPTIASPLATSITTRTHFTDNILRVGVNYQLH